MLCKAEQPEIRRLLLDTLTELNASIRFQMQTYHPNLVKSLTLKENIQNLLDSMEENHSANICLDCDKDVFLVEPYNVLIYRMIKELVTNALKTFLRNDNRCAADAGGRTHYPKGNG